MWYCVLEDQVLSTHSVAREHNAWMYVGLVAAAAACAGALIGFRLLRGGIGWLGVTSIAMRMGALTLVFCGMLLGTVPKGTAAALQVFQWMPAAWVTDCIIVLALWGVCASWCLADLRRAARRKTP